MRYIDLNSVLGTVPAKVIDKLKTIDASMSTKKIAERELTASNGNVHWTPIKEFLEAASKRKCWYTESRNSGCLNDVEHFRPKARKLDGNKKVMHWYWFLAFNPLNYRLSCTLPNRLNKNPVLGETGGKHDHFPLLGRSKHARNMKGVSKELPVLLDPCNLDDVELLSFSSDGRPVISPAYSGDVTACFRVERSNLLLNLDYPTFNEDREKVYNKVVMLVKRGDEYAAGNSPYLSHVTADLRALFHPDEEYSRAAECYVRCFRDRTWIDALF